MASLTNSAMQMAEVVEYLKPPDAACDALYKIPTVVDMQTIPAPANSFVRTLDSMADVFILKTT